VADTFSLVSTATLQNGAAGRAVIRLLIAAWGLVQILIELL
jgi:hypothetical protein